MTAISVYFIIIIFFLLNVKFIDCHTIKKINNNYQHSANLIKCTKFKKTFRLMLMQNFSDEKYLREIIFLSFRYIFFFFCLFACDALTQCASERMMLGTSNPEAYIADCWPYKQGDRVGKAGALWLWEL